MEMNVNSLDIFPHLNYQSHMKDLIQILSNTPLYRKLFFHVQVFDYSKKRPCPN